MLHGLYLNDNNDLDADIQNLVADVFASKSPSQGPLGAPPRLRDASSCGATLSSFRPHSTPAPPCWPSRRASGATGPQVAPPEGRDLAAAFPLPLAEA